MRGLASGRQGARQGNALALGKLLADVPALSINEVLATMASELEVSGQAKASLKLHLSKQRAFPHIHCSDEAGAIARGAQRGIVKILLGCC